MNYAECLSRLTGISIDKARFGVYLYSNHVFSYFLSILIKSNINRNYIHAFISTIGVYYLFTMYRWLMIHPLLLLFMVYIIIRREDKTNLGRNVFILSMSHLGFCHLFRIIQNYSGHSLDVSTPMMMMTQKTTLVAFYYQDLFIKDRINKIPHIGEYLSYCLFFPTILTGPTVDYFHYKTAITGSIVENFKQTHNGKLPSNFINCLLPLFTGSFLIIFYIKFNLQNPLWELLKNDNLASISSIYCFWCLCSLFIGQRCLYYYCWKLAESSCNLCYIGFGGIVEGQEDWTQGSNVSILGYEFAPNIKAALDNWNLRTAKWLRGTVYTRAPKYNLWASFFVSAFWHGFYLEYYYTFMMAAISLLICRQTRKKIRPYFLQTTWFKNIYDFVTIIITHLCLMYHTLPFILLDLKMSYKIWKKIYFIGHIATAIGLTFNFLPSVDMKNA